MTSTEDNSAPQLKRSSQVEHLLCGSWLLALRVGAKHESIDQIRPHLQLVKAAPFLTVWDTFAKVLGSVLTDTNACVLLGNDSVAQVINFSMMASRDTRQGVSWSLVHILIANPLTSLPADASHEIVWTVARIVEHVATFVLGTREVADTFALLLQHVNLEGATDNNVPLWIKRAIKYSVFHSLKRKKYEVLKSAIMRNAPLRALVLVEVAELARDNLIGEKGEMELHLELRLELGGRKPGGGEGGHEGIGGGGGGNVGLPTGTDGGANGGGGEGGKGGGGTLSGGGKDSGGGCNDYVPRVMISRRRTRSSACSSPISTPVPRSAELQSPPDSPTDNGRVSKRFCGSPLMADDEHVQKVTKELQVHADDLQQPATRQDDVTFDDALHEELLRDCEGIAGLEGISAPGALIDLEAFCAFIDSEPSEAPIIVQSH